MKKTFITFLLLNTFVSAFTFDVWKSTITLDEAIKIAESNILLYNKNIIGNNKKFDKSSLNSILPTIY